MMRLQYQYNEAAANNNMTRALEMWRKTGYEAQGQQIENAGLNKALMYGGGGASAVSKSQGNSGVNNTGTQAVAMGLQARAIEAQVSNTEADTALKIAQATKEAGEASKKPIELKIEQTNKEITYTFNLNNLTIIKVSNSTYISSIVSCYLIFNILIQKTPAFNRG